MKRKIDKGGSSLLKELKGQQCATWLQQFHRHTKATQENFLNNMAKKKSSRYLIELQKAHL